MLDGLTPEQVNSLFPVIGATLYPGGLVVKRLNLSPWQNMARVDRKRGEITHLSTRSRSLLALTALSATDMFKSLVTLTYGPEFPSSGCIAKAHLNRVLTRLRQVYGKIDYLWFLEFQRRGAPHFHILLSLPEPSKEERLWFADLWANIAHNGPGRPYTACKWQRGVLVPKGRGDTLEAIKDVHRHVSAWDKIHKPGGAGRYVLKYSTKTRQKTVPFIFRDVGRFWGCSRSVTLKEGEFVTGSEDQIRQYLWLKGREMHNFQTLPKICFT